jgi:hypothetical protein
MDRHPAEGEALVRARRKEPALPLREFAHGHHRFDWLYVTAFASPATGETFWYLDTRQANFGFPREDVDPQAWLVYVLAKLV